MDDVVTIWILRNKQGSFVAGVLSAASATHCGALVHALYLLSTVPMATSFSPIVTASASLCQAYCAKFQFLSSSEINRSEIISDLLISLDEKKHYQVINDSVTQSATQPVTYFNSSFAPVF